MADKYDFRDIAGIEVLKYLVDVANHDHLLRLTVANDQPPMRKITRCFEGMSLYDAFVELGELIGCDFNIGSLGSIFYTKRTPERLEFDPEAATAFIVPFQEGWRYEAHLRQRAINLGIEGNTALVEYIEQLESKILLLSERIDAIEQQQDTK